MSREKMYRLWIVAASALFAGALFAQTSPAADEPPISLLQALTEWSGEATSLELLVAQDHPAIADDYVRELEDRSRPVADHFERYDPAILDDFRAATGLDPWRHGRELFDLVATEPPVFARWQARLAAGDTLAEVVESRHPSVLAELDRANSSPATAGVTLLDFFAEKGYDHLVGDANELLDKVGHGLPPGSCACDVVVDFVTNPVSWSPVEDQHSYDGAPLPVVETRYAVEADGPAQAIDFLRRTKAKDFEFERKSQGRQATLATRLHCFTAGDPGGSYCQTGGCTAELIARTRYSTQVSTELDAGAGKAKILAYDGARLLYNPGQASEQTLISHGVGVSGEKRTDWDVAGLVGPIITLAAEIVVGVFTGFGGFSAETVTNVADGIVNLHHVDGADGVYASAMSLDRDVEGTLAPNVTYTLQLDTESFFYGWGRLHAHTRTRAGVASSFLMAAAVHDATCDPHVTPPEPTLWWRYAAADGAPEGRDFLRDQVQEIALLRLNTLVPQAAFAGDTATSGEGSYVP